MPPAVDKQNQFCLLPWVGWCDAGHSIIIGGLMGVIDGRVAIITGGARGIGASISRLSAGEGASLVINDLGGSPDGAGSDESPANQIADEIVAAGGTAVADGGDIGDVATGDRLVKTAVDQFGKLDI